MGVVYKAEDMCLERFRCEALRVAARRLRQVLG
jgi:hypothetical protein